MTTMTTWPTQTERLTVATGRTIATECIQCGGDRRRRVPYRRNGANLVRITDEPCPVCAGTGMMGQPETVDPRDTAATPVSIHVEHHAHAANEPDYSFVATRAALVDGVWWIGTDPHPSGATWYRVHTARRNQYGSYDIGVGRWHGGVGRQVYAYCISIDSLPILRGN